MSRSYRKPYSAITGVKSAADDKRVARRNWRHAQNNALRMPNIDWDEFLIPARYEASYNDVCGWGRDGIQSLYPVPMITWDIYKYQSGMCWTEDESVEWAIEKFETDIKYYERLKRK